MLVKYTVTSVDLAAGFTSVEVDYGNGIKGAYNIPVESIAPGIDATEAMLKAAICDVVKNVALAAFPPAPMEPPALLNLVGWSSELTLP